MKRTLAAIALAVLITGCGDNGKYDGVYDCDVVEAVNNVSISEGSPYVFPEGTTKTNIIISENIITINGISDGSYITPKLLERTGEQGDYLLYEDGDTVIGFSKEHGVFNMRTGGLASQLLQNCKIRN